MINVLIADDHPVVLKGLQQILQDAPEVVITNTANTTQQVLQMISKFKYDLVLLDISMPGRGGLEALKQIKIEQPKLPVLVLSIHPEDQYAVRVLRAGASGYLTKDCAPEKLLAAMAKVLRGGIFISSALSERLVIELKADKNQPPHASLSDREFQVMGLLASGKTVKEIAKELSLSPKTISTYRTRLMDKMNMRTNAELIHYAMRNKMME